MSSQFIRTKPSFLEAGLPCASLSAECQRDNSAASRPPQNTLHIWWARRPPTISRAAILSALLPFDVEIPEECLPPMVEEPTVRDLANLPGRWQAHEEFLRSIWSLPPTIHPASHFSFLRALGVRGDVLRAKQRIEKANEYDPPLLLGDQFGYVHPPAFSVTPDSSLVNNLLDQARQLCGLPSGDQVVVLDFMAGGGSIPLEAVRYGFKTFANDVNPVAALVLKATIEYPSKFGHRLIDILRETVVRINSSVDSKLARFFWNEPESDWWPVVKETAKAKFRAKSIESIAPGGPAWTRFYLWARTLDCPNCNLVIPLSTNFTVTTKGKGQGHLAAFPVVPSNAQGNTCKFVLLAKKDWPKARWPRPGFDKWDPRGTPTFKDGKAICPRCGHIVPGEEVKSQAKARQGGLGYQMYAVCSQVPVELTYKNGEEKIRYLWRFRAPTAADLEAVRAAEEELRRRLPQWEADGLVPNEEIPEDMEDKRPREYGMTRWRDFFLPRQLLTNLTVLEEIRKAQAQARAELPPDEAEAVGVYLAFILSKVVNYNSVNCFWHYGHNKTTQSFSRHDFAFRPAFCEMNGSAGMPQWGIAHVLSSYRGLSDLIHGGQCAVSGGKDEDGDELDDVISSLEDIAWKEDEYGSEGGGGMNSAKTTGQEHRIRPEVIVPTVTCEDAAALSVPEPGTVHLICVDPPYYNNVQYSELSNFFYVWLKRALRDYPGLAHLFREPLAESNREAVANAARWAREAEAELAAWQKRYDEAYQALRAEKVKAKEAKERALEAAGPKPLSAKERADRFYEDKMAAVFRRARQLLHPAGRMVVMFNHKQTWAWRALGMALIRAGFEVRSSVPIHTEAESSLNIRGLDAARSTILLLCLPREEKEQLIGNWAKVQASVADVARNAARHFHEQGIAGTDLYLSALGPAIGEVARNWPVTDFAGREVDLADALEQAYRSVGQWRLEELLREMSATAAVLAERCDGFSAEAVDRDSQALWLWLDTFEGEQAGSDEVRKLAKSLNVDPDGFRRMGLVETQKDVFILRAPQEIDLRLLSLRLKGESVGRGRAARAADVWEERTFPNFLGAAVWNAIGLMSGDGAGGPTGPAALRRWLGESGYGQQRDFFGAFAVTLYLLERVFKDRREGNVWRETARHARRAWDLVIKDWRS